MSSHEVKLFIVEHLVGERQGLLFKMRLLARGGSKYFELSAGPSVGGIRIGLRVLGKFVHNYFFIVVSSGRRQLFPAVLHNHTYRPCPVKNNIIL